MLRVLSKFSSVGVDTKVVGGFEGIGIQLSLGHTDYSIGRHLLVKQAVFFVDRQLTELGLGLEERVRYEASQRRGCWSYFMLRLAQR